MQIAITLADELRKGKTLLYPTETVWGLGCDAHNAAAVEQIYQIKRRPTEKKFILLVDSLDMLKKYVANIPQKAARLMEYYTKPLTIIYEVSPLAKLPPMLINDDNTVAIRLTSDPFCAAMIAHLGKAIVSTSANISGAPFPNSFAEIADEIKQNVDVVANYRQGDTAVYPPSTIVKVVDGEDLVFIRK